MSEERPLSPIMACLESHIMNILENIPVGEDQPQPDDADNNGEDQASGPRPPSPDPYKDMPRFQVRSNEVKEIIMQHIKNILIIKENAMNEERERRLLAEQMKKMDVKK